MKLRIKSKQRKRNSNRITRKDGGSERESTEEDQEERNNMEEKRRYETEESFNTVLKPLAQNDFFLYLDPPPSHPNPVEVTQ